MVAGYTLFAYSSFHGTGLFRNTIIYTAVPQYLDDPNYRELQQVLLRNPTMGDLMPGTGGFRKIRWQDARRGKGKRGGLRVIYYYLIEENQIWLFTLYDKDEAIDLTSEEKKLLKQAIQKELAARRNK